MHHRSCGAKILGRRDELDELRAGMLQVQQPKGRPQTRGRRQAQGQVKKMGGAQSNETHVQTREARIFRSERQSSNFGYLEALARQDVLGSLLGRLITIILSCHALAAIADKSRGTAL